MHAPVLCEELSVTKKVASQSFLVLSAPGEVANGCAMVAYKKIEAAGASN